jgi:hypothetical protein
MCFNYKKSTKKKHRSARSGETIRERTLLLLYWAIELVLHITARLELLHSGLIKTSNIKLQCLILGTVAIIKQFGWQQQ